MGLGLRCVGAGGDGGGEVGWELGGEDCGAGGGDEVFCLEGGEEGFFESWWACSIRIGVDQSGIEQGRERVKSAFRGSYL